VDETFSARPAGGSINAVEDGSDVKPQKKEKVYHIGNGVTPPVLTYSVDAEFTNRAKDAKHQGVSIVSCVVEADGMPRRVHTSVSWAWGWTRRLWKPFDNTSSSHRRRMASLWQLRSPSTSTSTFTSHLL
jgi:hypothetical protein